MSAGVLNEVVDAAKGLFFLIDLLQKLLDLSSKPDDRFISVLFARKGSGLVGIGGWLMPSAVMEQYTWRAPLYVDAKFWLYADVLDSAG
jgi:hypothetical protein